MEVELPFLIEAAFVLIVALTLIFFYYSNGKPNRLAVLLILYCIGQSLLSSFGFYEKLNTIPPRFILVLLPAVLLLVYAFQSKQIDWMKQNRDIRISNFLHIVRVPVEIVLYYLFVYKMVPELMTFEGRNYDIIAGLTAPIIGLLYWRKKISKQMLIVWNTLALCLVLLILANGLLSSELPFQMFAFEQPNVAVTQWPFVLLPAVVVPIVIYTHVTDIIKLRSEL